jgi:hypothetical protein
MNDQKQFLGIVEDGTFQQLLPPLGSGGTVQFTSIAPQESVSPESRPLSFQDHDGTAIMISGSDHGGWVYNAKVIDSAGPILTMLVRYILTESESTASYTAD